MAARYWVGADSSWNTSGNWSATDGGSGGAGVPTSSDDVYFTSSNTTSCTCDVAISCASLTVQSGYSGTFDFADSSYSHAISGDVLFEGTGTVDLGSPSTITIGGNYTYVMPGTHLGGSSTVVMTGTGKTIFGQLAANSINNLTIDNEITAYGSIWPPASAALTINASKTLTLATHFISNFDVAVNGTLAVSSAASTANQSVKKITMGSTGVLTIASGRTLRFVSASTSVAGIAGSGGEISGEGQIEFYNPNANYLVEPREYGCNMQFLRTGTNSGTIEMDVAGTYTFARGLTVLHESTGTLTWNRSAANPNFIFKGDVQITNSGGGTLAFTPGTGTATFEGTANQSVDFNGEELEDIEINKSSGTVTLTGPVQTDSFTLTSGTLNVSGEEMDVSGNFTMAAGTAVTET